MQSGFIAIIGETNSGKSTLINALLKEKVSITSPKAQTTRNTIKGILTEGDFQMIFLDTPGLTKSAGFMQSVLNDEIATALRSSEVKVLVVDCNKNFINTVKHLNEKFLHPNDEVLLVINKMDILKDEKALFDKVIAVNKIFSFKEVFFISALKQKKIDEFKLALKKYLPTPFFYYPVDQKHDYELKFLIEEVVREKCFIFLNKEIPYFIDTYLEDLVESKQKIKAFLSVLTAKQNHKKIIIGEKGELINKIKFSSEKELFSILKKKVFLEITVKLVKQNEFDYRRNQKILGK